MTPASHEAFGCELSPAEYVNFMLGYRLADEWRGVTNVAHWLAWLVLRIYAAFRPRRFIAGANVTRYYLTGAPDGESTGTPGWYLHELHGADVVRDEHNHPWVDARTRILRGAYIEVRDGVGATRLPGDVVALHPWDFHRVAAVKPRTWTLFFAGPKHALGWGFADADGNFRRARHEP